MTNTKLKDEIESLYMKNLCTIQQEEQNENSLYVF